MIKKEKKDCCGCTACQHVCPVGCIDMVEDFEGFLYPEIDEEKCIHCHKCETVCPIGNTEVITDISETYVGYIKDEEIRRSSSSGGIFTVLAEWMIDQGGIVIGAAFDESFQVHHIAVETKEELEKLRGSKYVQSNLERIYIIVKQYLQHGKKVLFSGTACQIGGLKKYLKNENIEQLYTVDVLCHGVPSRKVWRMYLKEMSKKYQSTITNINFRDKRNGWNHYSMLIQFDSKKEYCVHFFQDRFMKMFLGNLDLRPSCYDCQFKEFPRISDITIGDSWGIEKNIHEMSDDKGVSVIIINSEKGQKLFKSLESCCYLKSTDLDLVLPKSAESRHSVNAHQHRQKYLEDIEQSDFSKLYRYSHISIACRIMMLCKSIINNWRR